MAFAPHQDTGPMRNDIVAEEGDQAEKAQPGWQSAVPFANNKIPKPEGDMYEKLLAPLLEKDKIQCDAWKDEVQNLLIFAGLFSAVVTAFIVESYKGLQPDANDTVASLLLRIADRLDALNTSTLASSPHILITTFQPTPSSIRVNILWFISLILSLTTVLVGIISLQWLREHQKYDSFHGPELKFAIFNIRAESLARWCVPQVFAAMPLALQAALVLFFVGIIDFLLALNHQVAAPVLAVTALSFLFLLGTTVLPAFQAFALQFPFLVQVNDKVPVPIPFKSPQSDIVRRLSTLSKHLFLFLAYTFLPFYVVLVVFPSHAGQAVKQILVLRRRADIRTWAPFLTHLRYTWSKQLHLPPFYKYWTDTGSWTSSDAEWASMRTQYASILHECNEIKIYGPVIDRTMHGTGIWDFSRWIPNVYDCTRGFRTILKQTTDYDQVCRVSHCGQNFSIRYIQSLWSYRNKYAVPLRLSIIRSKGRALEVLLGLGDSSCKSDGRSLVWPQFEDVEDPVNLNIIHTLHMRAVLSSLLRYYHTEEKTQNIHSAWAECQLDLIKPLLVHHPNLVLFENLNKHVLFLELFFRHQVIFIPDLSRRWTSLLQRFFMKTAFTGGLLEHAKRADGGDTIKFDALDIVIWEIVGLQLPGDALSTMQFLAKILSASIEARRTQVVPQRPDFLAFTSSGYLLAWLNNGRDAPKHNLPVQASELLDTLRAYGNSLRKTLNGENYEPRDDRIRQSLDYIYNTAVKRFGEKYPAYAVQSYYNLTPAAVETSQPDNLASERDDHRRSTSVVSLPEDGTREYYEGNSIV